ncbi:MULTISPECIES: nitrogenase component 1 [unclassified Clostridium]|uniref:nitrogenase component 1 n=1 Tax=unclassified Clostridium TaxID=2614128 RepID=UPI0002974526|nr:MULTISPECIES: nitrogenase component 1 [unclassified Clostridium]EKQ55514.1 MAG: nitrogenase molybdenum-iron protein, alpha and beta chain [Clostridium sp. Maddingley MBC34-26]
MGYYEQNEPPVRDQRLTIGDSFNGYGCDLSECAGNGCISKKNRSFWQANACQMALSLMMAATIENAVIILHGPIGCGVQLPNISSAIKAGRAKRGKNPNSLIWLSTNMQKTDVIYGGENSLRETIKYADREFRPEIIFVVSTCAPSIIGDDVEDIVNRVRKEIASDITAIHCPGFKSRVVASAYDSFYHSLIRHIRFEPEPYKDFYPVDKDNPNYEIGFAKKKHQKSRTVNLFNATSINADDEKEIVRLLNALDLKVQIFTEYCSKDEFRFVSEAALNVSMCNVHDDYILKYLEEKYNIPYIIQGMPIGRKSTRKWLTSIAAFFGKQEEADRLCDMEETRLKEAIEPFLPRLKGKRTLLGGGVVRIGEEALLLKDLGLEILAIRAYHYDTGAQPIYDRVAEELADTPIAVSTQIFELANQVKKYNPDIIIDHVGKHGWIAKLGYPSVNLFSPARPFLGYTGEFAFVKNIAFNLENPSFSKRLSQKVKLPYKDSWYERDAFSYIKE